MTNEEVITLLKKRNTRVVHAFNLFQEDLTELIQMVSQLEISKEQPTPSETKD